MERGELKGIDGVPLVINTCSVGKTIEFRAVF